MEGDNGKDVPRIHPEIASRTQAEFASIEEVQSLKERIQLRARELSVRERVCAFWMDISGIAVVGASLGMLATVFLEQRGFAIGCGIAVVSLQLLKIVIDARWRRYADFLGRLHSVAAGMAYRAHITKDDLRQYEVQVWNASLEK